MKIISLISSRGLLKWMVYAAVPLAAFLSFSIQAVMGKYLVPWHGGSASTWLGAMMYFQAMLLAGYIWAYWILRRSLRFQHWALGGLAMVAILSVRLPPVEIGGGEMWGVILSLAVSTLPTMLLLFGTGIVLHGWLARQGQEIPYYLYAFSNLGSLTGLAVYPFFIEPEFGLSIQGMAWRALLLFLIILVGGIILIHRTVSREGCKRHVEPNIESQSLARILFWVSVSALPCIILFGGTQLLSGEIGSNPLVWVLPFGLYLMAFSLVFSGLWRPICTQISTLLLAVCLSGFILKKGFGGGLLAGWAAWWLLGVVAFGALVSCGLLYSLRPSKDFSKFYLFLALGGLVGGVFASISAPGFFSRNYEFSASAMIVLGLGLIHSTRKAGWMAGICAALVGLIPMAGILYNQLTVSTGNSRVHHIRNIYGQLTISISPNTLTLVHETTLHGLQVTTTPESRRRPTSYYIESSAIGVVLRDLQTTRSKIKVGAVGLGAGTLATYARKGDVFTFWDIDPKVMWLAQNIFSFIKDSPGEVVLVEADGRKGVQQSSGGYDLVVVDAFSGDAIPGHLLTKEAVAIYLAALANKDDWVLVHASNRYADLLPVVAGAAEANGRAAVAVTVEVRSGTLERDYLPNISNYIIIHPVAHREKLEKMFPLNEDGGRVTRTLRWPAQGGSSILWTDDRNSALDVLDIRSFFSGERRKF